MPLRILIAIFFGWFAPKFLSLNTIQIFYSLGHSIRDVLMFFIPFVVFSYLWSSLFSMGKKNSIFLILTTISLVAISNALAAFSSYGYSLFILPHICATHIPGLSTPDTMKTLWQLSLPSLSTNYAITGGLSLGLFSVFAPASFPREKVQTVSFWLRDTITLILRRFIVPFLPLYVFGFTLKMSYTGVLDIFLKNFLQIFVAVIFLLCAYIGAIYFIAADLRPRTFLRFLKNMMPAALTAFGSASSAAAMPLTLKATQENTNNASFPSFSIPATVNIHMMGDGLAIPFLACTLLTMTGQALPSLETYLAFLPMYCVYKFSAAAIPAGGMLVVAPLLESHLGLSPDLKSLVITLYILQDAIFTCANVLGNGAFSLVLWKVCKKMRALS